STEIVDAIVHSADIIKNSALQNLWENRESFFGVEYPIRFAAGRIVGVGIARTYAALAITADRVGTARIIALVNRNFRRVVVRIRHTRSHFELKHIGIKILEI